MSVTKLITAITLAAALLIVAMPSQASANSIELNQDMNQEVEIECTSGSYGQNTTCKAKGTQSNSQTGKVLAALDCKGKKCHIPAATGLDTLTLSAIFGTLALGTSAAIAKYKTQA